MNRTQNPLVEPIGVLGVGVEGRATAAYLSRQGYTNIEVLDRNPVDGLPDGTHTVFGDGHMNQLERFGTLFRSPGIRPDVPAIVQARNAGTVVTSALSHFMDQCPAPVIGITGTVGKGTAASIATAALEAAGFTVHLGGNIGTSPLDFIEEVKPNHIVVLEISSFQAMDITVSPSLGCILKTTSEHLNWHTDTGEYRMAKAHLFAHQEENDTLVFNADEAGSIEIAQTSRARKLGFSLGTELDEGLFLRGNRFVLRLDGNETVLPIDTDAVALQGRFNLENIAAAILLAICAGGDATPVCEASTAFRGLPHRLEFVTRKKNIRFFNDSYATRPEAAEAAVAAFGEPLALILGGSEKHADFSGLVEGLHQNREVRFVGLIGATAPRMEAEIRAAGTPAFQLVTFTSLEEAMARGTDALEDAGVLLMSPACASFGMFNNYKDRGEKFRAQAMRLAGA